MTVTLIGLGCGTEQTITAEAKNAINEAQMLIGAQRLIDSVPSDSKFKKAAISAAEIADCIKKADCDKICVLFSGDTGFYSGAKKLLEEIEEIGAETVVLPGISSVQTFSARLKRPWQDWNLFSAHGTDCDVVSAVMSGKPAFFLTGGKLTAVKICEKLTEAGLGELEITVGERLTYDDEKITFGKAKELSKTEFEPLCVMLAEKAPIYQKRTSGIPDFEFIRGKTPMTKQEVRAVILAKLAVKPDDVCWDIGAGTGSVSVEMALHGKKVFAVERDVDACELVLKNREKFSAWNLSLIKGSAPKALEKLPAPDCVFVGGSGGTLEEIFEIIERKNPRARVCVSAIALETLEKALHCMKDFGYEYEIVQIGVSTAKAAGSLNLLMAHNPIFLISGTKK